MTYKDCIKTAIQWVIVRIIRLIFIGLFFTALVYFAPPNAKPSPLLIEATVNDLAYAFIIPVWFLIITISIFLEIGDK